MKTKALVATLLLATAAAAQSFQVTGGTVQTVITSTYSCTGTTTTECSRSAAAPGQASCSASPVTATADAALPSATSLRLDVAASRSFALVGQCPPVPPFPIGRVGATTYAGSATSTMTLRLQSPQPLAGTLSLAVVSTATGSGSIDLGNDGSRELQLGAAGSIALTVPVVVTSSGITIAVDAAATDASTSTVTVSFVAGAAGLATQLQPCSADLGGYWTTNGPRGIRVVWVPAASVVTPYTFLVFGVQQLNLPIPPLGCPLGTDILIMAPVVLDPTTRAGSFEASLPGPVPPATFYTQLLAAEILPTATLVRTSNRLEIVTP